ncbi:MAG: thioesterase family protein [Rubrobacter sp.]|nr:thioesterase family protein [Rubrobacter sp.]
MASAETSFETPLRLYETEVRPEWVDYNGHMSEAFYVLVFGHTTDALLDCIGMDADYRDRSGRSLYTLEAHVSYRREACEAEPLLVTTQLLEVDHKRVQVFHAMYHAGNRALLATGEFMLLHVDTTGPRSAPFPEEVAARLQKIKEAHDSLPRPEQAGRSITIER